MSDSGPRLELLVDGVAEATLAVPGDGSLDADAQRIVHAVHQRHGVTLDVRADVDLADSPQHVIALGCLADNPLIETLCARYVCLVDRWYPGQGGSVLQFVASPIRNGQHILVVGGSDADGVQRATDRLTEQIESSDTGQLPWCLDVELGHTHLPLPHDRIDALGTATSPIPTPEGAMPTAPYEPAFEGGSAQDHLLRLGMYGPHADNYHLSRSSQFGLRYLYTGQADDADRYRRALLQEIESGVLQQLYHYKSLRMFQLWSTLGDSPVFTAEDRQHVSSAIQRYLLQESGVANLKAIRHGTRHDQIFNRHVACDALNLWAGADWMWRSTGDDEWLSHRDVADAYFEAQAGTDVPLTGLTEGYGSYLEVVLEWMLLSRPDRIRSDTHIRLWAERVIGLCTNTGQLVVGPQTDPNRYPYHLLRRLAHLLDDRRYLYVAELRQRQVRRGVDRVTQFSAGPAWAGDVQPQVPEHNAGLTVYPVNERLRQWQAPSIAADVGFDRAVARGGWEVDDDYLMVVGVRGGAKSLPNVGTIAAYERFGQRLITAEAIPLFAANASAWRHSGVTVSDGGGASIPEGAQVLQRRQLQVGHLFSFAVDMPGRYRWLRHLFYVPNEYLLVIDHVELDAPASSPFALNANWRCAGPVLSIDNSLACLGAKDAPDVRFYVQVASSDSITAVRQSSPAIGAPAGTPPMEAVMLHASVESSEPGGATIATLLHAVDDAGEPRVRLVEADDGWIVDSPGDELHVRMAQEKGDLLVEQISSPFTGNQQKRPVSQPRSTGDHLPVRWTHPLSAPVSSWTSTDDGSALAVGTEDGQTLVLDEMGQVVWESEEESAITALAFAGNDLNAGTRAGHVVRFDSTGQRLWSHQCQFRPERDFWPWWFLHEPTAAALAVGHDRQSGRDVIAVGTGSTSLQFIDAGDGSLISESISPYGLPDRIQAVDDGESGARFLVGHAWLTCGSAVRLWTPDGDVERTYYRSLDSLGRAPDEWDSCGVAGFWRGSLVTGGSVDRVAVLRHGAVNQLTVYDEASAEPVWDAGVSGPPLSLAVRPGETLDAARCYVVDEFGWLTEYDGTGCRVDYRRVADTLRGMQLTSSGSVVMWGNAELLPLEQGRRFALEATPLGLWPQSGQALLCASDRSLTLHDLPAGL